ncbi:MAG: amidohydrolase family protein, partial [Caldisericum sp.]|nr:amidohydrolase family protein [Caldisericum sp.]
MEYKVFKVSRCYCPEFIESELFIEVVNGVIVSISDKLHTTDFIDLSDFLVMPGFVDVHIHGFEGVDVNRDGIGGIKKMSKELPKTGVVAFLPTLVSDSKENILKILEDFNPNDDFEGAIPLGIHLEGVFINPKKHGAMDERFFVKPDIDYAKELIRHGNVRKFTVAPELENAIP